MSGSSIVRDTRSPLTLSVLDRAIAFSSGHFNSGDAPLRCARRGRSRQSPRAGSGLHRVSVSGHLFSVRPLMWSVIMLKNSERRSSLRGAGLAAYRGNLRVEIWPGRQICAGTSQIGGDTSNVVIVEGVREGRHE